MNEEETNEVVENENTTTINTEETENNETIYFENRVDEIAYNTGVTKNSVLFLIAIIVVLIVCFLLWKVLDNFISY